MSFGERASVSCAVFCLSPPPGPWSFRGNRPACGRERVLRPRRPRLTPKSLHPIRGPVGVVGPSGPVSRAHGVYDDDRSRTPVRHSPQAVRLQTRPPPPLERGASSWTDLRDKRASLDTAADADWQPGARAPNPGCMWEEHGGAPHPSPPRRRPATARPVGGRWVHVSASSWYASGARGAGKGSCRALPRPRRFVPLTGLTPPSAVPSARIVALGRPGARGLSEGVCSRGVVSRPRAGRGPLL